MFWDGLYIVFIVTHEAQVVDWIRLFCGNARDMMTTQFDDTVQYFSEWIVSFALIQSPTVFYKAFLNDIIFEPFLLPYRGLPALESGPRDAADTFDPLMKGD